MNISLTDQAINPWQLLQGYQTAQEQLHGKHGALVTFIGSMRDFNEGDQVKTMYLEHYPAMTQKHLEKIAAEATQRWDILDILMQHRYGDIKPNDTIVVLAVWSAHREEAFQACRFLIEELKSRAPFWKKETLQQPNDKTDAHAGKDASGNESRWVKQQQA